MKSNQKRKTHSLTHHQAGAMSRALSRREFVSGTAGLAASVVLTGGVASAALAAARNKQLPTPERSGIEHIIVVMMENRSFDHFLGWLPGADGRQAGLTYLDRAGAQH